MASDVKFNVVLPIGDEQLFPMTGSATINYGQWVARAAGNSGYVLQTQGNNAEHVFMGIAKETKTAASTNGATSILVQVNGEVDCLANANVGAVNVGDPAYACTGSTGGIVCVSGSAAGVITSTFVQVGTIVSPPSNGLVRIALRQAALVGDSK